MKTGLTLNVTALVLGVLILTLLAPLSLSAQEGEIPETTNPQVVPKAKTDTIGKDRIGEDRIGKDRITRPAGPEPSRYLSSLYLWFLGFVGIAALLAMVIGGVMYMFAGANLTQTETAKKWISNAIWGIVIAAFSFLLLSTINPDLVRGFNIQTVIDEALKSR